MFYRLRFLYVTLKNNVQSKREIIGAPKEIKDKKIPRTLKLPLSYCTLEK